jgi:hypothetical protein
VETGDDCRRLLGFDDKHQRVGKVAEQSASNAFVDDRKLAGIGADSLDRRGNVGPDLEPRSRTNSVRQSTRRGQPE